MDEAKTQFSDLFDAAMKGEQVVIKKNDSQMIQLVPLTISHRAPKYGSAKGLIDISDDFDAPISNFDEYMR
ncbi:MAG: prevent-host-death protein [Candidatus Omnitrophota bacterium]